ncbi:hypothetical protein C8Q78DRAFT_1038808 [Trametes maxima]|nr:hypothetical protein C8Q78DRAFT_1038808 [Trametes maxima]
MLKVLVHPLGAPAPATRSGAPLVHQLLLSFFVYLFASSRVLAVVAQPGAANGQTQGLSIVDNPQPNAVINAGSNTDVSIEVFATANASLGVDSLEVYLVSSQEQKNITVSSGPQLLTQEPGSTVKHIHFTVPSCLQTGTYNLTVYEASHFVADHYFAITPIPIQVRNNGNVSSSCNATLNALQAQPQVSSPPPSDLLPGGGGTTSANGNSSVTTTTPAPSSTSHGEIITVTAGDGDITIPISDLPGTIVVEPSGGAPTETMTLNESSGFITIFKTVAPTATATLTEIISQPVTITLEETYISTSVAPGTTLQFTVTQTILSTTEIVQTQASSPQQAGLLPINSGSASLLPPLLLVHGMLLALAFVYVFGRTLSL